MLPLAEASAEDSVVEATTEIATEIAIENVTEKAIEIASTDEQTVASPVERVKSDEDSMASSAERMTILRMVEQGKISAEDGARLLAALGDRQTSEKPRPAAFDTSRHLQVRVHDLATNRQKVNVTVPIGLVQLIWRWLPASAQSQFEQLQAAIRSGASGRLVEVVDQESSVRVEVTLL